MLEDVHNTDYNNDINANLLNICVCTEINFSNNTRTSSVYVWGGGSNAAERVGVWFARVV